VPVFFDVADKEKDEEPAEDVSCPVDVEGGKKQVSFAPGLGVALRQESGLPVVKGGEMRCLGRD
jgi:hypothetical protein